jgi:hypothetical protein
MQAARRNGEPEEHGTGARPLVGDFARLTGGRAWARVIWDDYDTMPLKPADWAPPGFFTWLVSATSKYRSPTHRRPKIEAPPLSLPGSRSLFGRYLQARAHPAATANLFSEDSSKKLFTLCCDPDYVREYYRTPAPRFRAYTVSRDGIHQGLAGLGAPPEVLEMVNGGAYETAAEALGICCDGPAALLQGLLQKRAKAYQRAVARQQLISQVRGEAQRQQGRRAPTSEEDAAQVRQAVADGDVEAALARVGAPSRSLAVELNRLDGQYAHHKEENGARLERLRGNLEQEMCQVCAALLEDTEQGVYVLLCCQVVLCGECVAVPAPGGARGGRRAAQRFLSRCPNCQNDLRPAKDHLLFLPESFDLENFDPEALALAAPAEDEQADERTDEQAVAPVATDEIGEFIAGLPEMRQRALAQLVLGRPVESYEEWTPRPVGGLLDGGGDAPQPEGEDSRFLVFTAYAEASRRLEGLLDRLGVRHGRLWGTRGQRDRAVRTFKDGYTQVLIATSSQDCAGLHLPEATHIVFYHRIHNPGVAAQVVGRAQRYGRRGSLQVVYLLGEAEGRALRRPE